jgi:hypothetical protein
VHDNRPSRGAAATIADNAACPEGVYDIHTLEAPASAPAARAEAAQADPDTGTADTRASAARNAPLSGHRARLAELNEQHAAATAALRQCQTPVARLRSLEDERQRREQAVVSLRSRYDEIVGDWIARGAVGKRPDPPAELTLAERAYADSVEDARIGAAAIPTHESAAVAAAAHLNQLTAHREQVLGDTVVEIVADHLTHAYLPAMQTGRKECPPLCPARSLLRVLFNDRLLPPLGHPVALTRMATLVRPVSSQLRKYRVRPGGYARCHFRTHAPPQVEPYSISSSARPSGGRQGQF